MGWKRAVGTAVILLAGLSGGSRSQADYPPPRNMSEMLPPTPEDWLRYYLNREVRFGCPYCPEPLVLHRYVYFYACPPEVPCGEPMHRSFRGVYGIFYPGPYYIEEPEILIDLPQPRSCRRSAVTILSDSPSSPQNPSEFDILIEK
ncbi:MAG: hypothetical protein U1D30_24165 [Planctomycetota bacterium]